MYTKYILKVGFKNKLNLIPLLVPIIIAIFLITMNISANERLGYIATTKENVSIMEGILTNQEGFLKDEPDLTEKDKKEISEASVTLTNNINLTKQSIQFAEKGDWTKSLNIQLKLTEENELPDIENGKNADRELLNQNILMTYATYKELAKLNAEPQKDGVETKGVNFVYRMMDSLFPIIFMICLIAIISNVVNSSIIGRMDIERLFPENPMTFQLKKMSILALFSVIFYFFFILVSFIIASILSGVGTFQYPINIYETGFEKTAPIINILTQSGILQLLSLLFVISGVYLISILAKNGLTTLFIAIALILGPTILTGQIAPMAKYLHILPTTYFYGVKVVTNQLAYDNKNASINFNTGLSILIFSNILIISIILIIKVISRKREMLLK